MQAPRSYDLDPILDVEAGDWPITAYDRPGLALSNLLLRGDVDAATRAMFSPQSLTPAELETFSRRLLGGRPNPLAKTLVDIATNPIVILGALVSLKYPIGTTRPLYELAKGLRSAPAVGRSMSYVHSAFANLRNLPGLWDKLTRFEKAGLDFHQKFGLRFNEFFVKGVPSRLEGRAIALRLQDWHKPGNILQQIYPEVGAEPLAPGLQAKMKGEHLGLTSQLRGWLDDIWDEFTKDAKTFEDLRADMAARGVKLGGKRGSYFPWFSRPSRIELEAMRSYGTRKGYSQLIDGLTETKIAGNLRKRSGVSIPDLDQLRELAAAGVIRPDVPTRLEAAIAASTERLFGKISPLVQQAAAMDPDKGAEFLARGLRGALKDSRYNLAMRLGGNKDLQMAAARTAAENILRYRGDPAKLAEAARDVSHLLSAPPQYSLDLTENLQKYLTAMSTSYAWHGTGLGKQITSAVGTFKAKGMMAPWQESYLQEELLPLMRGLKPWKVFERNSEWIQYKANVVNWIKGHPLSQKVIPQGTRNWLVGQLEDYGLASSESLGNQISHYFYLSTLGANMAPATKNLLQNIVTAGNMPGIGAEGLGRGMRAVVPKLGGYLSDLAGGVKPMVAFKKAFPEFVEAMGEREGILQAMMTGDILHEGRGMQKALGSTVAKAKGAMLMPFSASETFNRLTGFYAGYAQTMAQGGTHAEALKVGETIINLAHFPGGPLGIPRALLTTWGPLRQFLHFPIRYGGFLSSSTRMGADPSKLDFGTIGRAAAVSAGMYTAAKNLLGVDLSSGLMTGALPLPQYEQAPFYPWPFVPPMMSVIGSTVQAIHKGELEPLANASAMLVPGGLAIKKLNRTLGPKYADYENRTPDGRVPIYNKDQALIGAFTPWQLSLRAMGLAPVTAQGEQAAAEWLLAQRDKIRTYRRKWLEALQGNDVGKADQINREFQEAYPEFGPMQVKKSDITAMRNRREISRLQRILKGFPRAYRPLFESAVGEAQLRDFAANLPAMELSGAFGQGL